MNASPIEQVAQQPQVFNPVSFVKEHRALGENFRPQNDINARQPTHEDQAQLFYVGQSEKEKAWAEQETLKQVAQLRVEKHRQNWRLGSRRFGASQLLKASQFL